MAIQFIKDVNVNGDLTATRLIKLGGTSSQFLKADGSVDSTGYLSSVGLTMPVAFSVANSPLTANGTLEVTAIGTASQYIRGDGQLATLPTTGGGGSSVNYYLNGSIPSSVAGYQQMGNEAIIGGGTDFNLTGNGLIAQFLTDIGNPNRTQIPGGAWNFEMFFQVSSAGGNQKFYVELLKYDGINFNLISSSVLIPEEITGGTSIDLYLTSLAVPTTPLLTTDRLAVRVYITDNAVGRTITLHTENTSLCEIITTFSGGVTSLNGLTANTQYLAVGTGGSDFNISSVLDTHTFNLPTASSTKRGALSITDWLIFNSKISGSGTANYIPKFTAIGTTIGNSLIYDNGTNIGIGTTVPTSKLTVTSSTNEALYVYSTGGTGATLAASDYRALYAINNSVLNPTIYAINIGAGPILSLFNNSATNVFHVLNNGNVGIGTNIPSVALDVSGAIRGFGAGNAGRITSTDTSDGGASIILNPQFSTGVPGIETIGAFPIAFYTNYSEKMRITSGGNVGIGTTSPLKMLDIVSPTNDSFDAIVVRPVNQTQTLNIGWRGIDASFDFRLNTSGAERMVVTTAGNVGIGTTSPSGKLTISGIDAGCTIDMFNTGISQKYRLVVNTLSGALAFENNAGTETVRFNQNGNVGIGTTNPLNNLDINITNAAGAGAVLSNGGGVYSKWGMVNYGVDNNTFIGSFSNNDFLLYSAGTERMRITSGGNVGIGTTSPQAKLHSNSDILTGYFQNGTNGIYDALKLTNNTASNTLSGNGARIQFYNNSNNSANLLGGSIRSVNVDYGWASDLVLSSVQNNGYSTQTVNDAVWIKSNGNVGIGTTSPSAKLDIVANTPNDSTRIRITNTSDALYSNSALQLFSHDGSSVSAGTSLFSTSNNFTYGTISPNQTNLYGVRNGGVRIVTGVAPIVFGNGANDVDFAIERMRITSAGNVGIGTTSPTGQFEVFTSPYKRFLIDYPSIYQTRLNFGTAGYLAYDAGPATLSLFANDIYGTITLGAGGTERMRITDSGNVGIGTTSPSEKLEVQNGGSGAKIKVSNSAGGYAMLECSSSASSVAQLSFTNQLSLIGGNVGIGTSIPSALLNVYGNLHLGNYSNLSTVNFENRTNKAIFGISTNGVTNAVGTTITYSWADGGHGPLKFNNASGEVMRLDASGNLGIGTTNPTAKLDVQNSSDLIINLTRSGVGAWGMNVTSGGNLFLNNRFGTSVFQISDGGNVGIGTLGTGLVYSNVGVLTSTNPSDSRLKNNIADLNYGLNEILKLRPVTYNWKNDTINQGKQFGFIAQEVQEVMPELVKEFETEEGERLGLDKEGIYATLVKAIQEQQKQIEELKTLINK